MLSLKQILLCLVSLLLGGMGCVMYAGYKNPLPYQTPATKHLQQMQAAQRLAVTPKMVSTSAGWEGMWPSDWDDPFYNDDDDDWLPPDWDDPFQQQEQPQWPQDWDDPYKTPIGDVPWPLGALVLMGAILKIRNKQPLKND